MIKRIIDIAEPACLRIKHKQLCIEKDNKSVGQIPVEDIGILILQHPAVIITQAVIVACQENNTTIVFCDSRRIPCSITFPANNANSLHSKILQNQLSVTSPRKKQIWKQIIQQKIYNQAVTLEQFRKDFNSLKNLVHKVKSGDKDNCESQAAQKYWKLLFGNDFRRDRSQEGINSLLNYGYAIIRAMVARAIVAGGLHPALGLHHHNQYNSLNLADDLMEPFRPWVDRLVYQMSEKENLTINQKNKKTLLSLPGKAVLWKAKTMPLMVSCHYLIADLKRCFENKGVGINYPVPESPLKC